MEKWCNGPRRFGQTPEYRSYYLLNGTTEPKRGADGHSQLHISKATRTLPPLF